MANFFVSLFQQLDRAFPLQGANHNMQSNRKTVNESLSGNSFTGNGSVNPATGLPMHGVFDIAGNSYGNDGWGVNPATGLPMQGMIDVAGNPYGDDGGGVNPATGLPMQGMFDVAGNPYGTDNNFM